MFSFGFEKYRPKNKDVFLFLVTFFITLAAMMSELLSIRASKLTFGISFDFFIIPLAVLGIGLGGALLSILRGYILHIRSRLLLPALVFPLVTLAPFILVHYEVGTAYETLVETLFFLFGLSSYSLAGWIVSSILDYKSNSASVLYFFDLIGAACGVILAILISNLFGYESSVATLCMFSLLPAVILLSGLCPYPVGKKLLGIFFIMAIFVLTYLSFPSLFSVVCQPNTLSTHSNAYTQVNMQALSSAEGLQLLGISKGGIPSSVSVYEIGIDCRFSRTSRLKSQTVSDLLFLKDGLRAIPFAFLQQIGSPLDSALILGSGGGTDVTRARLYGVTYIDAVELNPLVIDAARSFASDPTDPYMPENVHLHIAESRQYVSASKDVYRIILDAKSTKYGTRLWGTDVNYASTEEAQTLYLRHLYPDGLLVETIRVGLFDEAASKAAHALQALGLSAKDRIAYIKGDDGTEDLMIIRKTPFSSEEKSLLTDAVRIRGLEIPIFLGEAETQSAITTSGSKIFSYETDDRPFVWNFFNPSGEIASPAYILKNLGAGLVITFILFLGTLLLPFFKKEPHKLPIMYLAGYFLSTGFGFIAFEIAVIERFSLVIANPAYTIAVALSAILLFGGLGSLVTTRLAIYESSTTMRWLVTCLLVSFIALFLLGNSLSVHLLLLPSMYRIAILFVILAVPSFLMGMFFPTGIKIARSFGESVVPWSWGISGIAGVLGGFAAKLVSFRFGITATFVLVAFAYCCAWVCFELTRVYSETKL